MRGKGPLFLKEVVQLIKTLGQATVFCSSCLPGVGVKWREGLTKRHKDTLGVMEMFTIIAMAMALLVHTCGILEL